MKKLFLIPLLTSLAFGCSDVKKSEKSMELAVPEKNIVKPYELVNLPTSSDFSVVRGEFNARIDTLFKTPYSTYNYSNLAITPSSSLLTLDTQYEYTNPITQLLIKCFKSDLKVSARKFDETYTSYRIASNQMDIDNCIMQTANEPMPEMGIYIFSKSYIYETYKDNPKFRDHVNNYKADGVITIKEFMDLGRIINGLIEADKNVQNKEVISNL